MAIAGFIEKKHGKHLQIIGVIAFAIAVFALLVLVQRILYQQELRRLEIRAEGAVAHLEELLEVNIQTLYGARGLLVVHPDTTRYDWKNYISSMNLTRRQPGMAVLSYVQRVGQSERGGFTASVKGDTSLSSQGYPSFEIHPPTQHSESYVVKYLEPFSMDSTAFGYDFSSEQIRREAVEDARDTDKPVMTGLITDVVQHRNAFVIVLPVYTTLPVDPTVSQRQNAFRGVVAAGFRNKELFDQVFRRLYVEDKIVTEIYDGTRIHQDTLLYNSDAEYNVLGVTDSNLEPQIDTRKSQAKVTREVEIAGRTWTVVFTIPLDIAPKIQALSPPMIMTIISFASAAIVVLIIKIQMMRNLR